MRMFGNSFPARMGGCAHATESNPDYWGHRRLRSARVISERSAGSRNPRCSGMVVSVLYVSGAGGRLKCISPQPLTKTAPTSASTTSRFLRTPRSRYISVCLGSCARRLPGLTSYVLGSLIVGAVDGVPRGITMVLEERQFRPSGEFCSRFLRVKE